MTPIAAVRSLLEEQRQALLTGNLAALDALPDRLEQAMRRLSDDRPGLEALMALAGAAARNAELVLCARAGLARARRDIAPPAPLTTYDAQGRRQPPSPDGQLIARR